MTSRDIAPSSSPRARRRAPRSGVGMAIVTLGMAMAAGLCWHLAVLPVRPNTEMELSWWTLAVLFAASERLVASFHFRREEYRYTPSEIPLVLGLLFADPLHLLIGHVVGLAAAELVGWRTSPLRAGFYVTRAALETALALAAFQQLGDPHAPLDPAVWAAVFAATAVSAGTHVVATTTGVAVTTNEVDVARFARTAVLAVIVTGTNTSLALAASMVLDVRPLTGLLLAVPAISLMLAYLAYVTERQRHQSLELLYSTAQNVRRGVEIDATVETVLREVCLLLRAGRAELLLTGLEDHVRRASWQRSHSERLAPLPHLERDALRTAFAGAAEPTLIGADETRSRYRSYLDLRSIHDAIVVPLQGERRMHGALVVGNRQGGVARFGADDLKLVTTLSRHLSVSLENERLEQTLAKLTELERRLTHQAFHDSLTGLANRMRFAEEVQRRIEAGGNTTVLFIDLDDFKTVNDTLGHATGDELLVAVARRLNSSVRPDDLVARLGGDEFGVLVGSRATEPETIADRLNSALSQPMWFGGRERVIRASIGIAVAGAGEDADDVLRHADVAMYDAKDAGKGRHSRFTPAMADAVVRRHDLQDDLARAVADREFHVVYQPVVNLADGGVEMVEALSRWSSPRRGDVSPDVFVPVAEESDLIVSIDRMAMEESFCQLARWKRELGPAAPRRIAVNLSSRHFLHADVTAGVRGALQVSGLSADDLVLEITETVMMTDIDANITRLQELRALGVRLALDDFGTGYSSLSYLRRLPLDILKVARPFVKGLDDGADHEVFVRAIVELAHTLDLTVVAEGIETEHQLHRLTELGCEYGQGYFFARPSEADALTFTRYARDAHAAPGTATV